MAKPLTAIAAIAVCAALNAAPAMRFGSGPLNSSVQNERDAALDRAAAWLVANQSSEGFWGASNVVATAAAAIALGCDREDIPEDESRCVQRALAWLSSTDCTNSLVATATRKRAERLASQKHFFHTKNNAASTTNSAAPPDRRGLEWCKMARTVIRPDNATGGTAPNAIATPEFEIDVGGAFDDDKRELFATLLRREIEGRARVHRINYIGDDPVMAVVCSMFAAGEDAAARRASAVQSMALRWNNGDYGEWLDNAEAGWWLARAINSTSGGALPLKFKDGEMRDVNWRGILAGKWINSQRIDGNGRGHWGNDAETTAFAMLLLNEM